MPLFGSRGDSEAQSGPARGEAAIHSLANTARNRSEMWGACGAARHLGSIPGEGEMTP